MHTPAQKSSEKTQLKATHLDSASAMGSQHAAPPPFQLKAATAPHLEQEEVQEPEALQFQSDHDAGIVQWMPNDEGDSGSATPPPPTGNGNGLPQELQSGAEALSGIDLSDVNVHYNSNQPAQYQAHAYAQGTDIHLGPGQEQHLPHEAWHVVQQKQGRVQPTRQFAGGKAGGINDDAGLETEADVMGAKALAQGQSGGEIQGALIQSNSATGSDPAVQRKINGMDKRIDFEAEIAFDMTAKAFYDQSKDIQELVDKLLQDNLNYDKYKSIFDPQMVSASPLNKPNLTNRSSYAKWVKALYWSFFEDEAGFDENHASTITPKTTHDQNWYNYITQEIGKIPIDPTVKALPDYINKYADAKRAAKELDKKEVQKKNVSTTIKKDLSNEFAAIKAFNKLVTESRDLTKMETLPMIPEWKTESKYGTGISMKAEFFPHSSHPKGSGNRIKTPIDWFYQAIKGKHTAKYVKGHLLNDHVGGLAKNYNLSPLQAHDNKTHESGIEFDLKNAVGDMQRLRRNHEPQTYDSILYEVELGPQTKRPNTNTWTVAANYLENCNAKNATIKEVKNKDTVKNDSGTGVTDFSNAPKELLDLILAFDLFETLQLQNFIQPFIERRLVWEMEDYLVREWYVRLQINHSGGPSEIKRLTLANEKDDDLNENIETLETKGGGNKWDAQTSRPPALSDTSPLNSTRPLGLEKALTGMSPNDLQLFYKYLGEQDAADQIPGLNNPTDAIDLYKFIQSAKQVPGTLDKITKALTNFHNEPDIVNKNSQRRAKSTQIHTSNMLYMGGKNPQYRKKVYKELTNKDFNEEEMDEQFSGYMGDRSSPEREIIIKLMSERINPDQEFDKGKRQGRNDGRDFQPFSPDKSGDQYVKGYAEGYYFMVTKRGHSDGAFKGGNDGRNMKTANEQPKDNPYTDTIARNEYAKSYSEKYLSSHKSNYERVAKEREAENRERLKKSNSDHFHHRSNSNGHYGQNPRKLFNSNNRDKRKRKEQYSQSRKNRGFIGNTRYQPNASSYSSSGYYNNQQGTNSYSTQPSLNSNNGPQYPRNSYYPQGPQLNHNIPQLHHAPMNTNFSSHTHPRTYSTPSNGYPPQSGTGSYGTHSRFISNNSEYENYPQTTPQHNDFPYPQIPNPQQGYGNYSYRNQNFTSYQQGGNRNSQPQNDPTQNNNNFH